MGNEPEAGQIRLKIAGVAVLIALAAIPLHIYALSLVTAAPPYVLPWWVMAIGFAVTELLVVRIHTNRDVHSLAVSELPLMIGLALASPTYR